MRFFRTSADPAEVLAAIVIEEREKIVRLWAKRLRAELHEVDLPGREMRLPLDHIVGELGRLLRDRGEEAIWMFAEAVRSHGARRFEQRFDPEDVAHEFAALHGVLLRVVLRATGGCDPPIAGFLAALIGEAIGSVLSAYARVLRTEEVRFREAAAMESVLHHLDTGILLVDGEGAVAFATPAVTRLVGVPARAFLGAKAADTLRLVLTQVRARHPDLGTPFRASEMPWVRALEEKRRVSGVRMAIDRHPDGAEVIVEMNATPLVDEATGQAYGVVQTMEDRTELVQRERAQQELVRQATETAHALNNSLNVLRLKLGMLRREGTPGMQSHLDEIERALRGAADRVRTLQDAEKAPSVVEHAAGVVPQAPLVTPAPRPVARRVLVVDDDLENARVTAEVLGEEGYDVRVANDGKAASELWRGQHFDAALLDAVMPDVSGWDLALELRASNPHAALAVVTGADIRGIKREELSRVDAVFRKPVDAGVLDEFLSGN